MDLITSVTAEQLTRALADTAYLAMSPPTSKSTLPST